MKLRAVLVGLLLPVALVQPIRCNEGLAGAVRIGFPILCMNRLTATETTKTRPFFDSIDPKRT
jgi:hypothetical protein